MAAPQPYEPWKTAPAAPPPAYAPAQPGYGQAPPAYGYPPMMAPGYVAVPVQVHSDYPTFAAVMFILTLVRDLLYAAAFVFVAGLGFGIGFGSMGGFFLLFALLPILGVIGSAIAMICCFQRKSYNTAVMGAMLAVVGSGFPGIFLIGPIGLILGIVGVILLTQGKHAFTS